MNYGNEYGGGCISGIGESDSTCIVLLLLLTLDRLLALEMGRPVLINDQDCEVELPCPVVDEQYISDSGGVPDGQQTTPLLATIHVVKSIGQLIRTLRNPTISPATVDTFERHFETCLATFPASNHPKSDQPLDPRSLAPIIYLQNARLVLHRHNLSPLCPIDARSSAFEHCLSTTLDTAHLLSRCLQQPPNSSEDRPAVFASAATTMLCTHIWRCTLLLLFRQEYAAALVCVQSSALIGDFRSVNAACGRYLAFFLRCLLDRICRPGPPADLGRDEELIAYVSGDMQGSTDSGWVWHGSETGSQAEVLSPPLNSPSVVHPETGQKPMDWEGWEWINRTVQYLLSEQQQQRQQQQLDRPGMVTHEYPKPNESTLLSPEAAASVSAPATAAGESESDVARRSSSSRMTIASII